MKQGRITELEKRVEDLKAEKRRILDSLRTARAELEACRSSSRRREELYHAAPSILVLIQDGRITDTNNSVAELLGYDPDALLGKPFLEIVDPEDRPQVREIHARRLARKAVPEQYEAVLVTREGRPLSCEVRVRKILLRGKRAFVVSLTPMDKRREREENRLRSKKMEAVLTMASALAARFERHCTALQDQIKRLGGSAPGAESPIGPELRALETITRDALRTTDQLKTIARERMEPSEARVFDLRDVVKEAVSLGQGAVEGRGDQAPPYQLKTYLRSGARIFGNPEALRDVIAHLVRNALEAMPGGGDLYVTSEESGGQAHLTIMDNGGGVPDQVMDRIFDPFFTTRSGEASGLGLSVAYAVIRRHGGEIEVTSEKGQGTEIRVRLPVAAIEAGPRAARTDRTRRPGKVLVIASTRVLGDLLDRFFSALGWQVVTASGVREGLGRLRRETCAGIILESAGSRHGRDELLCRSIKNRHGDVPVVLIAGNGRPVDHEEEEGRSVFDLVVHKPLLMDAFEASVRRLFSTGSHPGKNAIQRA